MTRTRKRTCHICEANCGLVIELEDRKILSIKGDPGNALSRGHICPKATALQDVQDDPDRLRRPQKRVGDDWQEISWARAFSEIGERTRAILATDPDAAAIYLGNPNAHSYGNLLSVAPFRQALGQPQMFSASTVDQRPHQVANFLLFGHSGLWAIPDIDRTETLIILGGNPVASNGSVWTVPDFRARVKALQSRGGQLVVIDPRRTETARIADRHLFIRPATDALFLVALLAAVLDRRPLELLPPWVCGLGEVAEAIAGRDHEAACAAAGIGLDDVAWLADKLCSGPAALYGRMGVSTQETGTLNAWLIGLINIAAGQLDREGGLMFPAPAIDLTARPEADVVGSRRSRVSGHPEILGEFPAAALAEEVDTPGPGQIKALFVVAGNPVLSTPNGGRLDRALDGLDLMVSIDIYRNATSRRADYILPPVGPLERDHYGLVLLPMAVRNFATYSPPTLEAEPGEMQDWEILRGLAGAIMGQPIQAPPPREMIDAMLQSGDYRVSLADLEAAPSGLDFGALQAGRLPERLRTADKVIQCANAGMLQALASVEIPAEEPGLLLIGRRHLRTNNSWLSNSKRLVKGPERCTLLINPVDAEARALSDGHRARVSSSTGTVTLQVEVTDDMMPGTVSIPHGWGHGLRGIALGIASTHAGVSVNDLTDDSRIDPFSGNAGLAGVIVEVEPAAELAI